MAHYKTHVYKTRYLVKIRTYSSSYPNRKWKTTCSLAFFLRVALPRFGLMLEQWRMEKASFCSFALNFYQMFLSECNVMEKAYVML